jgi:hypothetical protein
MKTLIGVVALATALIVPALTQVAVADPNDVIVGGKSLGQDPDSNVRHQTRGPSPSAEVRLARGFLDRLGDVTDAQGKVVPGIRSRIAAGELNGNLTNRGLAIVGQGGPGELRRAIDEGAEALLRGLTGAGMNRDEAANYVRRYQFSPIDASKTAIHKLNDLEAALRYTAEVGKGRGGDDFLKGFPSQFGRPVVTNTESR